MVKLPKKLTDPFLLSFTTLVILAGVLAFLKFSPKSVENKPWLLETIDLVNKIEITIGQEKAILKKDNDNWLVVSEENSIADQEKIDKLLSGLKEVKKTDLVSQNKDNHSKYGLGEFQAINLKASQDDNLLLHLLIGMVGPDFESDYIRLPNEDKVYLSNLGLRSVLIQPRWSKEQEGQED